MAWHQSAGRAEAWRLHNCRRREFVRGVAYQATVGEDRYAIGKTLGQRALVRDHDDGHTQGGLNFAKQQEDLLAIHAVEIAGWFVGEQYRRAIHQRPGQRAALLLAAGEFAGAVAAPRAKPHVVERRGNAGFALAAVDFGQPEGQLDVFFQGHARKEIERLKDHADGVAPVAGEFDGVERGQVAAAHVDGSRSGAVQPREQIEEGGFAGAGAAQQGQKFARPNIERDIVHGGDDRFA